MEWDRLDQAAGGRNIALGMLRLISHSSLLNSLSWPGTKLHQETRKKITRRKPALITAIKKFNGYCEQLRILCPVNSTIHRPEPLPLDLVALRQHPRLMEDVWIAPAVNSAPPRWLEDSNVRAGILAYHKSSRCQEEKKRCGIEADNMCRWFGEELAAIEVALRLPQSM